MGSGPSFDSDGPKRGHGASWHKPRHFPPLVPEIRQSSGERGDERWVGTVRHIVRAAPSYLAAHGAPRSLGDLDGHDRVRRLPRDGDCVASWWFGEKDTGRSFQRPVRGTMTFGDNDAVIEAGLAGAGLVQLHTYMAAPHLKSGALTQVLGDYVLDVPPNFVLFATNKQLSPKVRAFIEFISETLAD
jgi:LysR family transcriptional regulator for bpeEF and oprC